MATPDLAELVDPHDYAESVIDNTLALLAMVVTSDDVVDAWAPRPL